MRRSKCHVSLFNLYKLYAERNYIIQVFEIQCDLSHLEFSFGQEAIVEVEIGFYIPMRIHILDKNADWALKLHFNSKQTRQIFC